METSAKTGFNVKDIFVTAGKILYQDYIMYRRKSISGNDSLKITTTLDQSSSGKIEQTKSLNFEVKKSKCIC